MMLMHTVLGANASSRLFMNLREDKGYTYGAYSNLDARRTAGTFRATAEVRSPVTGDSLKEFFYELERIGSDAGFGERDCRREVVSDGRLSDSARDAGRTDGSVSADQDVESAGRSIWRLSRPRTGSDDRGDSTRCGEVRRNLMRRR